MQYLCVKQLTVGGMTYNPGNMIPDGVILSERSSKLIRNGYISKVDETDHKENETELFTREQVDEILAEAIEEAVNNTIAEMEQKQKELQEELLQPAIAELREIDPAVYQDVIQIAVKCESDDENEQYMMIMAKAEEIQQLLSIMQLNAENGCKAIADVKSENVLILLHAADSRKTIKEAAKKQADNLFTINKVLNESSSNNESTDTNSKGADT